MSTQTEAKYFKILRSSGKKLLVVSEPTGYQREAPIKHPHPDGFDAIPDADRQAHRRPRPTTIPTLDTCQKLIARRDACTLGRRI